MSLFKLKKGGYNLFLGRVKLLITPFNFFLDYIYGIQQIRHVQIQFVSKYPPLYLSKKHLEDFNYYNKILFLIGDKMINRKCLVTSTIFLAILVLFSSLMPVTAVVYPYSVTTGDKIPYNVTALKNGSYTGWLMVWGINLSVGDNFFMEIFDRPANPTTPFGTEFTIRFVKGDNNGVTFAANSVIFTNNKTYWESSATNSSFDVGGTIYSFTYEGDIATWSWTTDADNFVTVKFDINDGLLQSYERKTENFNSYGYTHFKYEKGGTSSIPSFELPISIISLFIVLAVIRKRKKT